MPLPASKNFLSPLGFRFVLQRAPNIEYFTNECPIPGITLEGIDQPSPMQSIWRPGTKMQFAPMSISFGVDEEMLNYKEIFNWMIGLAPTRNSQQYADLKATQESLVSDGTLVVLTSNNNEGLAITFENLFPTDLSEIQFRATDADVPVIVATATFRYTGYYFV